MDDNNSLALYLYLYPIGIFGLGTVVMFVSIPFGILLYIVGGVVTFHLLVVSIIRERSNYIWNEDNRLISQRKLYETVMNMDNEARYAFGLSYVPKEVLVKIDKTSQVQNEFSQIWRKLPIAPYKLKVIAQAAINGEGFTVRKWAGDDKLLTRDEWDVLLDSMIQLGLLEWVDPEHHSLGTNWTSLGEDVMIQTVKDML